MASVLGQGANLGRWLERFDDAGIPATNQRKLSPADWRRALFGKKGPSMSRPTAKAAAVQWAAALLNEPSVSDDTAESLCMAAFVFREWLTPVAGGVQRGQ